MNDYQLKSAASIGAGYGAGYASDSMCATAPVKMTVIEDAISQVELMRQQLNLINGDVIAFLDRAAGGALNGIGTTEKGNPSVPSPAGQLPRLGQNLKELKWMLNTLGEHVSKLNQIA